MVGDDTTPESMSPRHPHTHSREGGKEMKVFFSVFRNRVGEEEKKKELKILASLRFFSLLFSPVLSKLQDHRLG